MLFLIQEPNAKMISEKAKGSCNHFPAHSNQCICWQHCIGVGFLPGHIGEAMGKLPFSLAFFLVKESFIFPAIFFYLENAANNNKRGTTLTFLDRTSFSLR
jgi:hypothetical protein